MKAIVYEAYGGPEVLKMADLPRPEVKADDILVKIYASAVNSADVRTRALNAPGVQRFIMRLITGWNKPKQPILGNVFSGQIVEIGPDVSTFRVGDEIYGWSKGMNFGCYAEYVAIKEDWAIARKPEGATHEEAVALIFGGTTAQYFMDKVSPQDGQSILIYGASGAVGVAATQIAMLSGLEVTAVASGRNESFLKQMGVNHFIDYTKEDISKGLQKYDIVFDAVGKINKKIGKKRLKEDGHYITVASLDIASETSSQMEKLTKYYEEGKLLPVIDRIYPMNDVQSAHRYVDEGHKRGNVILKMI